MGNFKQVKGITLIALVITIIVLLILAGITINLTIGQGGILKMAEQSGENYVDAADYEREELAKLTNEMDDTILGNRDIDEDTIVLDLKYTDIFESYTEYVVPTGKSIIQKNGNLLRWEMITGNNNNGAIMVPSTTWTTIGVLKPEYRPVSDIAEAGTNGSVNAVTWWKITTDGTVQVYQASGIVQQCVVSFMYFTK